MIPLQGPTDGVWHVHVDGVAQGSCTVTGSVDRTTRRTACGSTPQGAARPVCQGGHREIPQHRQPAAGLRPAARGGELTRTHATPGPIVPKAIVVDDDAFDWQGDVPRHCPRAARHLRGAHQGFHRTPVVGRRITRHLSGVHREDPAPARRWASTPSSCCPCTSSTSTTSWWTAA